MAALDPASRSVHTRGHVYATLLLVRETLLPSCVDVTELRINDAAWLSVGEALYSVGVTDQPAAEAIEGGDKDL
jgi:hypothetical protein